MMIFWSVARIPFVDARREHIAVINRDYGYVDPHRNTEQGEEYSADIEKVIPDEPSEPDAP